MARLLVSCFLMGMMYAISTSLMALLVPDNTAFLPVHAGQNLGRRDILQALGASAVTLGATAASADNQGEKVKAMRSFAPEVLALKDAIDSGDTKKILGKEKAFKLLTTYWRNNKADFKEMTDLYNGIMDAAYAENKEEMKALYAKYISRRELDAFAKLPPPDNYHIWNVDNSMTTR